MSKDSQPEDRLPVDPKTGRVLERRAQPGYYPGFSTLAQQSFWDDATRKVVLERVREIPPIRFFTPEEARLMAAVCARLLPQDDRDASHRIPIVPRIDERSAQRAHSTATAYEICRPTARPTGWASGDRTISHATSIGRPFLDLGLARAGRRF